jgi:hypothetical protein
MPEKNLKLLDHFTGALDAFEAVLDQVPESSLDWREEDQSWSVRQIIHHVTEDCNVYAFIIEQALATPGCKVVFGEFPGNDAWGEALNWGSRPVEASRELMRAHRKFLVELVGHFPDRMENQVHFFSGDSDEEVPARNTVEKMIEMLTEHMEEHTETVKRIIALNQE